MYLIGIKNGKSPCGNSGTIISDYKSRYKLIELATNFKTMYKHDQVYFITNYPQKACELSPTEFVGWIKQTGVKVV